MTLAVWRGGKEEEKEKNIFRGKLDLAGWLLAVIMEGRRGGVEGEEEGEGLPYLKSKDRQPDGWGKRKRIGKDSP